MFLFRAAGFDIVIKYKAISATTFFSIQDRYGFELLGKYDSSIERP